MGTRVVGKTSKIERFRASHQCLWILVHNFEQHESCSGSKMIMKVIKISNLAIIWMVNLKFYRELKNSLYNVIFMIMTQVIRLVPTHPGQHDKNLLFFREFRKHSVRLCSVWNFYTVLQVVAKIPRYPDFEFKVNLLWNLM